MGIFAALVKQCPDTAAFVPFVKPGQVFFFYPIRPDDVLDYTQARTDIPLTELSKARVAILDLTSGTFTLYA